MLHDAPAVGEPIDAITPADNLLGAAEDKQLLG
jgi:hypothetical protein